MTIRNILRMGDPGLLKSAEPVQDIQAPAIQNIIQDMYDTMYEANGAGLAAPQIGVNLRIVIYEVLSNPRYPEADTVPRTTLINPTIEPINHEMETDWEGCLSVPGLRGQVSRYRSVKYSGFDEYGRPIKRQVEGFHARVVQHECDHLDGVLYPMRMDDLSQFGYQDVLFPT